MNTYLMINVKEELKQFFDKYPSTIQSFLELDVSNPYAYNQVEAVFQPTTGINEKIFGTLCNRNDYTKRNNIHTITNQLTKDVYKCVVHEHYIEIQATKKTNTFLDILYHNSKNYVIINKQC